MTSPKITNMKASKLFLSFAIVLISIASFAQQRSVSQTGNQSATGNCSLGTVSPGSATICAGSSVTLQATPVASFNCFTDKVLTAGNLNYQYSSTAVDQSKNVYFSGAYNGDIGIGVQPLAGIGNRSFFLVKYDSCGKLKWAIRGGSSINSQIGNDGGKGIATDANGNVYVVGRYNQTCTIYGANGTSYSSAYTNNSSSPGAQDGFLVKINATGEVVWGSTITGGSNDGFNGVTVDANGNPIVTTVYNGNPITGNATIYSNNTLTSLAPGNNSQTAAVIKFSAAGAVEWITKIFNNEAVASSLVTDVSSNIYVTGWYNSINDGAPAQVTDASNNTNTIANAGIGAAYLLKLNSSGNWQWGTGIGNAGASGNTLCYGNDVAVDAAGNPWVAGY